MPYHTIVEDHGEWFVANAVEYVAGPFKTFEQAEEELYEREFGGVELEPLEDDDE